MGKVKLTAADTQAEYVEGLRCELSEAEGLLRRVLSIGLDEGESIAHGYHSVSAPSKQEQRAGDLTGEVRAFLGRNKQ